MWGMRDGKSETESETETDNYGRRGRALISSGSVGVPCKTEMVNGCARDTQAIYPRDKAQPRGGRRERVGETSRDREFASTDGRTPRAQALSALYIYISTRLPLTF